MQGSPVPKQESHAFEVIQVSSQFMKAEAKLDLRGMWDLLDPAIKNKYKDFDSAQALIVMREPTFGSSKLTPGPTSTVGFLDLPDIKIVRYPYFSKESSEVRVVSFVVRKTNGGWKVLFCSPSIMDNIFIRHLLDK